MSTRLALLRALRPVTRLIDRINLRVGRAPLTGEMLLHVLNVIEPGDLILATTRLRPTNMMIPGEYKHVLIAERGGTAIEAVTPVVRRTTLIDVWANTSMVRIVRHATSDLADRELVPVYAAQMIGKPYDSLFMPGDSAFYCSELAIRAHEVSRIHTPSGMFTSIGPYEVIAPQAFADSPSFRTVFDSREWPP